MPLSKEKEKGKKISAHSSKFYIVPNIVQGQNEVDANYYTIWIRQWVLLSGEVLSKKQRLLKPLGQIMRLDRTRGKKREAVDVKRSQLKLKRRAGYKSMSN